MMKTEKMGRQIVFTAFEGRTVDYILKSVYFFNTEVAYSILCCGLYGSLVEHREILLYLCLLVSLGLKDAPPMKTVTLVIRITFYY